MSMGEWLPIPKRNCFILITALSIVYIIWLNIFGFHRNYHENCTGIVGEHGSYWQRRPFNNTFYGDLKRLGKHQDDPELVRFIKERVLIAPSGGAPLLTHPFLTYFAQSKQDIVVDDLLKQRRNGFYIEAGGYEGELASNTLFFERERAWTGLLIEVDPVFSAVMSGKNRNAYIIEGCLSSLEKTEFTKFSLMGMATTSNGGPLNDNFKNSTKVFGQCYPLWAILQALGRTHVDYLSLDIEGSEAAVLDTIPFHKVTIDVITAEYRRYGDSNETTLGHRQRIRSVMDKTKLYRHVTSLDNLEDVYIRNDMVE